ncbi:MAG: hypothetical protein QOG66_2865 [Methylobacteriaceae bacterium]|jgi:uncharacterized protein YdeI (YjbR/CyaY-like superfamily)|nr:hypothetical protein [Methylobacteriaceae bacterium]
MSSKDLPVLAFSDESVWENWLHRHGATSAGVWLKLARRGAAEPTVTKSAAIEVALCHGWIDGQLGKFDDGHFLLRFTPRRPGSRWSIKNREAAQRLIDSGRMGEAGLREIEAARADGRWRNAYASQGTAEPPPDFAKALRANSQAQRMFASLDRANRFAMIYRVQDAKRPDTRSRRIAEYIEMLIRGETLHPRKSK